MKLEAVFTAALFTAAAVLIWWVSFSPTIKPHEQVMAITAFGALCGCAGVALGHLTLALRDRRRERR